MKSFPLVKFVILFSIGIIVEKAVNLSFIDLLIASSALIIISVVLLIIYKDKSRKISINSSVILVVIFLGASFYSFADYSKTFYPFQKTKISNAEIFGEIHQIDLPQEDKIQFVLKSDSIIVNNVHNDNNYNFLVRIYDNEQIKLDSLYGRLDIGREICIKGTIKKAKIKRNPGEFDYQKYLESQNISGIVNSYHPKDLKITNKHSDLLGSFIFNLRKSINTNISDYHDLQTTSLLRGLLLADRGLIDYRVKENFINAGVIHVLAVSGLHVGYIVLIFLVLFNRFNPYLKYFLTILGILFFLILTNGQPSVFRASVMAVILMISFLTNRSYNSINALSLAALIILLINPGELFLPGFQLSFSAVLSIILLYPIFRNKIKSLKIKNQNVKIILLFGAVSIAAQIGTLPFTLTYFHKLSVISIFLNLIVVPLIGVIVALGIVTIALSYIIPAIAVIYAAANELLTKLLFLLVLNTGSWDFSFIPVYKFSEYDLVIFYMFIGAAFYVSKYYQTKKFVLFSFLLIGINLFVFLKLDNYKLMPDNYLSVMAIDVGQGDSFLVKFPNGKTALIDAGNATKYYDNGERVILPQLKRMGIYKIDYGFISHTDADHYAGFLSLINYIDFDRFYKPLTDSNLTKDVLLEKYIRTNDIPIKYYHKEIIKIGNCRVYILNDASFVNSAEFSTNNKSGILKIVYGNTSILFTGDAEKREEKAMLAEYAKFLKSNILKVGHHGSKTSSGKEFLHYVNPEYALISAGLNNRFHHPSKKVIYRLKRNNIKIKRTDRECALFLQSNGHEFRFNDWKKFETGLILN